MGVLVITPSVMPVSLETLKAHLRDPVGEDALIEAYAQAAWAWIDGPAGWLGRSLRTQTLELRGHAFACGERLPCGPATEIVSVNYVDPQGVERTLAPEGYVLAEERLCLAHGAWWPALRGDAEGVRIRYKAGPDEPPPQAVQALLLLVGQWYATREAVNVGNIVNEMPHAVEALLQPLRRFV